MTAPRVSAVIVSWNSRDELRACLGSLQSEGAALPLEVLVVDNASDDGTPELVRDEFPDAVLIGTGANLGFAAGCNRGLAQARAPFVLLLNPDAELRPGALAELLRVLETRPELGVVGPRTLNSDGTPQLSWGPELSPLAEWRQRRRVRGMRARDPVVLAGIEAESQRPHEPDWVSGACMLARREAIDAVNGFDEGYFLYEEDVDLCRRLRKAGWKVAYHPGASVVHGLGRSAARAGSRVRLEYHRSHLRYYRRHRSPAEAALLRGLILLEGAWAWLRSLGPGAERRERREAARRIARLALAGAPG